MARSLRSAKDLWEGVGCRGDSVPLRFTPAPPTVRLVHFVNGQPAGPSPYTCPGVDKPPGTPHLSRNAIGSHLLTIDSTVLPC